MRNIFRSLAFLVAFLPGLAAAQVNTTNMPASTVVGRSAIGPGPAQAIPFSQLIASMLSSGITVTSLTANTVTSTTVNANSVVYKGSSSGQATVQAQAAAGTPALTLPTVSGTFPSSATSPLVLDPVTGNLSCPTCATATTTNLVLASRATAAALNLSAFNAISTLGYAAAGDGGGATFKNVGTAPFIDSYITGGTITAGGSSYTNGTYPGTPLSGGTGTNVFATVVVSGNAVTSVTVTGTGGNGYTVNDSLTTAAANIGGTGSGFTWKVTSVSTPKGSFTDTAGDHFQIIVDQGNSPNVRQFGATMSWSWSGGDAGATNDQPAFNNALQFANYGVVPSEVTAGGTEGNKVIVPAGAALICGGLTVPVGVTLQGQSPLATILKQCDADPAASHFITLCDPISHLACFGAELRNLQLFAGSGSANSSIAMIYTNSDQQFNAIERVAVYTGKRLCLFTDVGYGGAASFGTHNLFCTINGATTQSAGIVLGYTAAVTTLRDSVVESSGISLNGISISTGGVNVIDGLHSEGITQPIYVNVAGATTITNIHNVTGGSGCTSLVTRQNGSSTNQINVGTLVPNGCTNAYNNGGVATTGLVVSDVKF